MINRMGLDVFEECIMVRESYSELAYNDNFFCIGGVWQMYRQEAGASFL